MEAQFFTYRLMVDGETVRIGKASAPSWDEGPVLRYLRKRYGNRFDMARCTRHSTESAAFKAERRQIDAYRRAKGRLPRLNRVAGGAGGQSFVHCKAKKADGHRCMNLAYEGNYGFCGVHRCF